MNTELMYLVWVTLLTMLLWVPYVLNRIMVRGIADTVGYPENPKPLARWAERTKAAHANAVENLVIFATLVLAAQVLGVSTALTATAAMVYFWARVVHVVVYALGIPWLRTLAFTAGFAAQLVFVWELLV
ncbi:MAG: MAPEG family protein [Proteobacteria bacterium]|nr:MAPEG family protein [Pseudomonadota bacterium]